MEPKKNPQFDVSRQSKLFFNIGLIVSLSLCIAAFEWKTYDDFVVDLPHSTTQSEDPLLIPITAHEQQPLEPPKPKELENIKEVDNNTLVDTEIEKLLDDMPEIETTHVVIAPTMPAGTEGVFKEDTEEILSPYALEQQPAPVGGMEAFYKYLSRNLKYPDSARRMGISGKVFVQFVVDKDGSLSDVEILKGIGSGCDEEAVRVVKTAPKWNPGKQRSRPVRVRMSIPIVFKMPD